MGAAPNPALILQMLKTQAAGGSAAGGATGSQDAADSVGPAMRELQQANPDYTLKTLTDLKKRIADMIPQLAMRIPAASRALVSTFKGLDSAIDELKKANQSLNAVGGTIKNSAIPQPQPPSGDVAAPDVMKPASVGM